MRWDGNGPWRWSCQVGALRKIWASVRLVVNSWRIS